MKRPGGLSRILPHRHAPHMHATTAHSSRGLSRRCRAQRPRLLISTCCSSSCCSGETAPGRPVSGTARSRVIPKSVIQSAGCALTELRGLGAQLARPHLGRAIDGRGRVGVRVGRRRRVVLLLLRQLRVPCNLRRGCGLLLRLVSRALAAGGGAHTPARTAPRLGLSMSVRASLKLAQTSAARLTAPCNQAPAGEAPSELSPSEPRKVG